MLRCNQLLGLAALTLFGCDLLVGIEPLAVPTCDVSSDCPASPDVCRAPECSPDGICEYATLGEGEPATRQRDGDCKITVCHEGVAESEPDDTDVLEDGKACTADLCDDGTVKNPPLDDGESCTVGGSKGMCVAGACEL